MNAPDRVPGILDAAIHRVTYLPERLENGVRIDPWTETSGNRLMFTVPGVARYLVENGNAISVAAVPGADPNSVDLFLNGPARGSLIHQRGELALEGTTVVAPNGNAIAICGRSAVGKSTLAAELCKRGWALVADDITRVTWTRGRALAWPSNDALKLWHKACTDLGIDTEGLPAVRTGMQKYYVKMRSVPASVVLRAVVELRTDDAIRLATVSGDQALATLYACTFRKHQLGPMNMDGPYNRLLPMIASACRVMVLTGGRRSSPGILADQLIRGVAR
jgi:hypothetical protein